MMLTDAQSPCLYRVFYPLPLQGTSYYNFDDGYRGRSAVESTSATTADRCFLIGVRL